MNSDFFKLEILPRLTRVTSNDWSENNSGTKLIGHTPKIAPKSYVHIVYPPITSEALKEFESRYQRVLPAQYRSFLLEANGLNIYSGQLRVKGYVPLERDGTHVHKYPSSFMIENDSRRFNGLGENDAVIGWYKEDGSYAIVVDSGDVVRVDVNGSGSVLSSWNCFNSWLIDEIERIHKDYLRGKISVMCPTSGEYIKSSDLLS